MGRKRADTVLPPVGEPLPGREWVTAGGIPDGDPVALIERGYEFQGGVDEALSEDWGVPVNAWVAFQSTYVHQAGWWPTHEGSGSLFVELLNGGVFRYDNVPQPLWQSYLVSPSHGQEQYYVVDRLVYAMLRPPYRKVTDAHRQANYARTSAARTI